MSASDDRAELDRCLRERWAALPDAVRTTNQLAGRRATACGATHGVMEACNYSCTSCYLSDLANVSKPLPFADVIRQLDALRRQLGPGAKVQITSGEVTLLPVDDLGRMIAHARAIGLDPMVMTNGQRLFDDPDYLLALVQRYGLEKVCCHIDTTQPERTRGHASPREHALDPERDWFAELVRATRAAAAGGRRLHAAHTVTVTADNLDGVTDVVQWGLRNADAVRMISLQPLAAVGRTVDAGGDAKSIDAVWRRVERAVGRPLNRHGVLFGHPECNTTVPVLVVADGHRRPAVFELVRSGSRFDRWVVERAIATTPFDVESTPLRVIGRGLGALAGRPVTLAVGAAWVAVRGVRMLPTLLGSLLRGRRPRLRPMLLVVHRFMGPDELDTPVGRERLEACVFKLPLADGSLVSMCEMNATSLRAELTRGRVPERFLQSR